MNVALKTNAKIRKLKIQALKMHIKWATLVAITTYGNI